MLANVSLSTKLFLSFGVILLLTIVVGGVALYDAHALREQKEHVQEHVVAPLERLSRMGEAYQQSRVALNRVIQTTDLERQQVDLDRIYAVQRELNQHEQGLSAVLPTNAVRDAYAAWSARRADYGRERDVVIAYAQAGDLEAAQAHASNVTYGIAEDVTERMERLRASVLSYGDATSVQTMREADSLRALLLWTIVGTIVLSAALAFWIAGRISRGMGGLQSGAARLVGGDLDVHFERGRTDEIGALGGILERLAGRLVKRDAAIDTILSLSHIVTQERDLGRGLRALIEGARRLTHARLAHLSVYGLDPSGDVSLFVGPDAPEDGAPDARADGFVSFVHVQDRAFRSNRKAPPSRAATLLAVPIRFDGQILGALYLSERGDGTPCSSDDHNLIESLAAIAAITIDGQRAATARRAVRKQLEQSVGVILDAMSAFADGDLSVHLDESTVSHSSMDELPLLYAGFNRTVTRVGSAIREVSDSVDALAAASVEMSATVEQIAASTDQQSHQARDVTHAMGEMVDTINANALVSMQAAESAASNGRFAKDGGDIVQQTAEKVREVATVSTETAETVARLGASSREIGTIAATIAEIAEQTNLLALNATIEAARAGESGRGFAVVADEVRKLAMRTAKATRTIEDTIGAIQTDTETAVGAIKRSRSEVELGVVLAEQAGLALERIVQTTDAARDRMMQIAAATEEQSVTSAMVAQSMDAITRAASEAAHGTQEVAHATNELSRLAVSLQETVRRFRFDAPLAAAPSGDGYAGDRPAVALPAAALADHAVPAAAAD